MLKLMKDVPRDRRRFVLLREMGFALLAMLFFNFLGEGIFQVLAISETTVRLSSGIILFLFAVTIIFPSLKNPRSNLPEGEPFVTPLAIPLIAGPALLATIMLFAELEPSIPTMVTSITVAWGASLAVLVFGCPLQRLIGDNGLQAIERLTAMILVLLGIQRFMEGIQLFLQN